MIRPTGHAGKCGSCGDWFREGAPIGPAPWLTETRWIAGCCAP